MTTQTHNPIRLFNRWMNNQSTLARLGILFIIFMLAGNAGRIVNQVTHGDWGFGFYFIFVGLFIWLRRFE